MRAWVYMLCCADGLYYVGSHRGEDIGDRVDQHNAGVHRKAWTYSRRPVRLVWSDNFGSITDAIAVERQIKGWSRAKKEALIRGAFHLLPELARGRTGRPAPDGD